MTENIKKAQILIRRIFAIADNDEPSGSHGFPQIMSLASQADAVLEEQPESIQTKIGVWADSVFPQSTNAKICEHLRREVEELTQSFNPEEAADCMMILLHFAHKNGFDILAEVEKKHLINLQRKWGKPDTNGVVEHIREQPVCQPEPIEFTKMDIDNMSWCNPKQETIDTVFLHIRSCYAHIDRQTEEIKEWEKRHDDITGGMMRRQIELTKELVGLQAKIKRLEAEMDKWNMTSEMIEEKITIEEQLQAEIKRLEEKIEVVCKGISAPNFKEYKATMAKGIMPINLNNPEEAFLYGWEAAILECGETLSKP